MDMNKFKQISVKELTTHKDNYLVKRNYWWVVTDQENVLFFVGLNRRRRRMVGSPQCNFSKDVAEAIQKKLYPECTIRLIEVAYLPQED